MALPFLFKGQEERQRSTQDASVSGQEGEECEQRGCFPQQNDSEWFSLDTQQYLALGISGNYERGREGDTERLNLWSQRNLILAIKTTPPIDFHISIKAKFF